MEDGMLTWPCLPDRDLPTLMSERESEQAAYWA